MSREIKLWGFGLCVAAVVAIGLQCTPPGMHDDDHDDEVHWSYSGDTGPAHWGDLSQDFAACSNGMQQSPIDIANPTQADLENISFDYGTTALNILNNGHTVQVNYDSGSSIMLDGKTYNLVQFHFHTPSEHTVNNQSYAMEVHFVHSDASGNLAVVGVLVTAGAENSAYAPILNNAPAEEAEEETIAGVTIDADDLLPTSKRYFTYGGSLTTPPCSEGVKWLVLVEPIEMSQAQIDALANILHNNNRPVQSLNGRTPQEDTTE